MSLTDLTHDELLVLIGFLRSVMRADGVYTDPEKGYIAELSKVVGAAKFRAAMEEAYDRFPDVATLREGAEVVERDEARHLIVQTLIRAAAVDGVDEEETKPLSWLTATWGIQPAVNPE
jgi:hypothetical protein